MVLMGKFYGLNREVLLSYLGCVHFSFTKISWGIYG